MIHWLPQKRFGPIGVDIGARSVKLVQFSGDRSRLIDASRAELGSLPEQPTPQQKAQRIVDGLKRALADRNYRGREAVICLGDDQLFLQSLRLPKQASPQLDKLVAQE